MLLVDLLRGLIFISGAVDVVAAVAGWGGLFGFDKALDTWATPGINNMVPMPG